MSRRLIRPVRQSRIKRLRRAVSARLKQELPGTEAFLFGRWVLRLHPTACMVYLFCLLLCTTQLLGLYVYLPVLGTLYPTDFSFLTLFLTAAVSLTHTALRTRRLRLSSRFLPLLSALCLLILVEIAVTRYNIRQPLRLIAREGFFYLVPPLCFLALIQYPEIRRADFLPRFMGLIVLFSVLSSLVALCAFTLYSLWGVNLLQVELTREMFRYGTLRLRVHGIVLYTGLIISLTRLLRGQAGGMDALNLVLGLINVLFISKTRTVMLYLGLTFFWMMMTEKRVHPLFKLFSLFLIWLAVIAATAVSDRLIPAVREYAERDPGIMVRFRAIDHYMAQFRTYPLTGIGLLSSSKQIPGWELLYGPRGQYYRSDVGAVGLINEFGLLGLFWVIWFLFGSFRRAGRSPLVLPRVVRSLVVYLTISMVNLSMMDPGRCMYIFLVCSFLETMPAESAGPRELL